MAKMTRLPKQELLGLKFWGGKRKGAGRPNRSGLRAHVRRAEVTGKAPLHVTIKVNRHIPNLKKRGFFALFHQAVLAAREHGLRVNHYSIQSNHLHLIVEADSNRALACGMKSLSIRLAINVKKKLEVFESAQTPGRTPRARTGTLSRTLKPRIFQDRYHLRVLKTPTEVRRALEYVVTNDGKHTGVVHVMSNFSSVNLFWRRCAAKVDGRPFETISGDPIDEICASPRTWLLRTGWELGRTRDKVNRA